MGAHRIAVNFGDIEQKAANYDREKETLKSSDVKEIKDKDVESKNLTTKLSNRFLLQELESKAVLKSASTDKKANVVERLGMSGGISSNKGRISHSVASGIKTIPQEGVPKNSNQLIVASSRLDDDWEIIEDDDTRLRSDRKTSNVTEERFIPKKTIHDDFLDHWETSTSTDITKKATKADTRAIISKSVDDDTLKKFANAKAISSDQYFGDSQIDYEAQSRLNRLEGSTGIGSEDLFGSNENNSRSSYTSQMPEMSDIKDSMRMGASKVAGKLSSLGSSVASYLAGVIQRSAECFSSKLRS
ncbi:unnamed protein product [Thelazia callipaeda]|uniref:ADP-ribosylation factor GTPase-activating protein AGD8 n=1 Tax=Thelazia callipaeda TaxID=103827 RepID=A0A0N5D670_THECL|nr:unnamed protein product [Thelazia callipaeda]